MVAYHALSKLEGIVPALESSHALYLGMEYAKQLPSHFDVLIGVSGRGDKDYQTVAKIMGVTLDSTVTSVSEIRSKK